jgi:hypothetical protein
VDRTIALAAAALDHEGGTRVRWSPTWMSEIRQNTAGPSATLVPVQMVRLLTSGLGA